MTFQEMIAKQLSEKGLSAQQAFDMMFDIMEDETFCPDMQGHWDKKISDYPMAMCNAILIALWPRALTWIEKNKPDAWFLVQFTPEYFQLSGKERDAYVDDFMAIRDAARLAFGDRTLFAKSKKPKKSWSAPGRKKKRSK